jgi:hypothetical protein
MKEVLSNDISLLVSPIFENIDECPYTCCAMICDLISNEKMKRIFDNEDFGKVEKMAEKYKRFYIDNKIDFLIEKLASKPILNKADALSLSMQEIINEVLSFGKESIHSIYRIIDDYPVTCLNLIPLIVRQFPFDVKNVGIDLLGTSITRNIQGMVSDFKKWYNDSYVKQTVI